MQSHLHKYSHVIFSAFIGGSVLLGIFLLVQLKTLAEVQPPSNPDNNAPTATIVEIVTGDGTASTTVSDGSPLNLTAGGTVPLHVTGTFIDYDGCSEVVTGGAVYGLLMRDDTAATCTVDGAPVSDGGNTCYAADSCVITACDGSTAEFQCTFNVAYNAHATTLGEFESYKWNAFIVPLDETMVNTGSTANDSPGITSSTFEIATHIGVGVSEYISFGTLALGELSGDQQLDIYNLGNEMLQNFYVGSESLMCAREGEESGSGGVIPDTNLYITSSPGELFENLMQLSSTTPAYFDGQGIPVADDRENPVSQSYYLRLQYPSELIAGTCTGTIAVILE